MCLLRLLPQTLPCTLPGGSSRKPGSEPAGLGGSGGLCRARWVRLCCGERPLGCSGAGRLPRGPLTPHIPCLESPRAPVRAGRLEAWGLGTPSGEKGPEGRGFAQRDRGVGRGSRKQTLLLAPPPPAPISKTPPHPRPKPARPSPALLRECPTPHRHLHPKGLSGTQLYGLAGVNQPVTRSPPWSPCSHTQGLGAQGPLRGQPRRMGACEALEEDRVYSHPTLRKLHSTPNIVSLPPTLPGGCSRVPAPCSGGQAWEGMWAQVSQARGDPAQVDGLKC